MEVQDAIVIAKQWILENFKDEKLTNLGLEEVEFDDGFGNWKITIGFSRPWEESKNIFAIASGIPGASRAFKIVTVNDKEGRVISLKNRPS